VLLQQRKPHHHGHREEGQENHERNHDEKKIETKETIRLALIIMPGPRDRSAVAHHVIQKHELPARAQPVNEHDEAENERGACEAQEDEKSDLNARNRVVQIRAELIKIELRSGGRAEARDAMVLKMIRVVRGVDPITARQKPGEKSAQADGAPFSKIEWTKQNDVHPFPSPIERLRKVDHNFLSRPSA
jgi:hypothetical protein